MSWVLTLLFLAGAVLLGRIYYGIRKMKEKTVKDWDAAPDRAVAQIRV